MGNQDTAIISNVNGYSKKKNFHVNFTKLATTRRHSTDYKDQLRMFSIRKYKGMPPPPELIRSILEKTGMAKYRFEIAYDIPHQTLQRYLDGLRHMPVEYWHIFYEFDNLEKFYSNFKVKSVRKKKDKKPVETPAQIIINEKNKSIIDAIRSRIT